MSIEVIVGIISAIASGSGSYFITHFLDKRKYNAEVDSLKIENEGKIVNVHQDIIDGLRNELKNYMEDNERYRQRNSDLVEKNNELRIEMNKLMIEANTLRAENSELLKRNNDLLEENNRLKRELVSNSRSIKRQSNGRTSKSNKGE